MDRRIRIYEVGPRDGLQSETAWVTTAQKKELIESFSQTGVSHIEATAFVSPKWVPQMKDADQLLSSLKRTPGLVYSALTPNLKGYDRAKKVQADEVAIFAAATETFSRKNLNCSVNESLERFASIAESAAKDKIKLRAYVSCAFLCPYEGGVDPKAVANLAQTLMDMGCYEVSLADTIGKAETATVISVLEEVCSKVPASNLAGHFHDTSNGALDNVLASLHLGLRTFDTAIAGLGGCPFAPGSKGNLSTLKLHLMLTEQGWQTGLDAQALVQCENLVKSWGLSTFS